MNKACLQRHKNRFVMLLGIALSACTSTPPPLVFEAPKASVKPETGQALVITDPKTKTINRTQMSAITGMRTSRRDERLLVNATLKNNAGLREVIAIRVRWLDEHGVQTAPYAPSESYALEGGEEQALVFVAPNAASSDIRIELETLR